MGTIINKEIYEVLDVFKDSYQRRIAEKLLEARKKSAWHVVGALDYHPSIPCSSVTVEKEALDLELLNILLDFEVARRLQGGQRNAPLESLFSDQFLVASAGQRIKADLDRFRKDTGQPYPFPNSEALGIRHTLDGVPIASAVFGILKLSTVSDGRFTPLQIFYHTNHEVSKRLTNGNVAGPYKDGEYDPFDGLPGVTYREEATKRILGRLQAGNPPTAEQIHQGYLEVYGGASESEGDEYLTTDEEAAD